ncbi:MAG: DUF2752 domain-containing protein [Planctomycetota bacterium]
MIIAALPSKWLERQMGNGYRAYQFNIFISSVLICAGLAFFTYQFHYIRSPWTPGADACLFHNVLAVACPFCGVSRSVAAIFHGEISGAWNLHPAGPIVAFVLVLQIPLRLLVLSRGNNIYNWCSPRRDHIVNLAVAAFCIILWIARMF